MTTILEPESLGEVADAVRSAPRVSVVGAGTKPPLRLGPGGGGFVPLSTRRLAGIVAYDPGEFTITVRAGTPVADLRAALAGHDQHLPCDPPLAEAGATIGGTVAAGLNGPGAFRFGGIRDFLIGVLFVDGEGRRLSVGGKVVKNAAGFDVARLLVGSLGCLGVLAELTFKVFPRPAATATVRIPVCGIAEAVETMTELAAGTRDLEALRFDPAAGVIEARLGGHPDAVERRAARLAAEVAGQAIAPEEAAAGWRTASELAWSDPQAALAKVPVTPDRIADLVEAVGRDAAIFDLGGQVAWVSGETDRLANACRRLDLAGLVVRAPGDACPGSPWLGPRRRGAIHARLAAALDPAGRFPEPPWHPEPTAAAGLPCN